MGIDRIGKGGPTLPTTTTAEVGKSGQSFEATLAEKVDKADKAEKASSVGAVEATATSPLERLRAGQIDLNGYLDLKVHQAVSHLSGTGGLGGLSPQALDTIKRALREQLATDPTLSDLVKGASGQTPALPGAEGT
ncbi:hypothetical protein [Pendulispora albinea]|uniref:Uncharacterized protein n=1 Tax=Pendulispora albinea TaxID=2741071 RepID=A0ABZ2LTU0_9BACT